MADVWRPSSFLPSVKCSDCGFDIEISRMGDHVCISTSPPASTQSHTQWTRPLPIQSSLQPSGGGSAQYKSSRLPPPRIDPSAANRPFARSDPLTPRSSSSNPRTHSPLTPYDHRKSPFRPPNRSATSPLPRPMSPPSPELSNLDCAFPPFPMSRSSSRTPTESQSPRTSRPSTRGEQRDFGSEVGPMPIIPPTTGGGSVLQRMNTIAPGPFGVEGRSPLSPESSSLEGTGQASIPRSFGTTKDYTKSPSSTEGEQHFRRPSAASSEKARELTNGAGTRFEQGPKHRHVPTLSNGTMSSRPERPLQHKSSDSVITSDEKPSFQDSFRLENRSQTFPLHPETRDSRTKQREIAPRRPSEPTSARPPRPVFPAATRPVLEPENPTRVASPLSFTIGPDGDEMASRSSSRNGRKASHGKAPRPPLVPQLVDEYTIGNPYHTPTESQSSNGSGYASDAKTGSSRSTPPLPDLPDTMKLPSTHYQASHALPKSNRVVEPTSVPVGVRKSPPGFAQAYSRSPPSASSPVQLHLATSKQERSVQQGQPLPDGHIRARRGSEERRPGTSDSSSKSYVPESPMDPAMKGGVFQQSSVGRPIGHPNRTPSERRPPVPPKSPTTIRSGSPQKKAPSRSTSSPRRLPESAAHQAAPQARPLAAPQAAPQRRPTGVSRGKCRGCAEPITGKSVSSADGRLTGRYHKQCFVCRTCKGAFETATFYVIADFPYCERHYHQLNNSLCHSCDRGIEGQYLETERKQKFHSNCFSCQDCRKPLREDYFEMNGKVYCEPHAFRRAQQTTFLGPGRRNPERRTTRLMMMQTMI